MVTISFNTEDLDEKVREKVEPLLTRIAADLSNYLKDEIPTGATGQLKQSVQILGFDSNPSRKVVAVRAKYADAVRLGRKPGSFPPLEPLKKWVSRVIGEAEYSSWSGEGWEVNSLDEATYIVGKSIEESGTDANPYLERSIKRLNQKYS